MYTSLNTNKKVSGDTFNLKWFKYRGIYPKRIAGAKNSKNYYFNFIIILLKVRYDATVCLSK